VNNAKSRKMKSVLDKNFIIFFTLFFLIAFSLIIFNRRDVPNIPTQNSLSVISGNHLTAQVGDTYVPLADGFYVTPGGKTNQGDIFEVIYKWMIGIAIAMAIVMIIYGGVMYMTIDSISGKSEGLSKVRGAIAGLLLAVSSYIILNTINPQILGNNGGTELSDAEREYYDGVVADNPFENYLDNNLDYNVGEPTVGPVRETTVPENANPSDRSDGSDTRLTDQQVDRLLNLNF